MSVTLNGRSYTNASFTGYGYLGIFPEQFAEDLLAQAAIIAPDATTVSAKAAAATASAAAAASSATASANSAAAAASYTAAANAGGNAATLGGFAASQTPGANQVPVVRTDTSMVLPGALTAGLMTSAPSASTAFVVRNKLVGDADATGTTGIYIGDSLRGISYLTREKVATNRTAVCLYHEQGYSIPMRSFYGDYLTLYLYTADTARVTIDSAGRVGVGVTPSAAGARLQTSDGITFPATQVPSADANTLDDYEEGTWTPVLGGMTSESGQTYTINQGTYTKIGRQVFCTFYITLSAKGAITGNCALKNLPFTVGAVSSARAAVSVGYFGNLAVAKTVISGYADASATQAPLYAASAAAITPAALAEADLADNTTIRGSFTYCV